MASLPDDAEIEAVGVPLLTLINANFAEEVAVPPMRKSTVVFAAYSTPFCCLKKLPVLTPRLVQDRFPDPSVVKT